jgi:hypothetical protein
MRRIWGDFKRPGAPTSRSAEEFDELSFSLCEHGTDLTLTGRPTKASTLALEAGPSLVHWSSHALRHEGLVPSLS